MTEDSVSLIDVTENDSKNYLELEHIPRDSGQKSRAINVVNFEMKNRISIGRGYESELRIGDISVSRTHAFFSLRNGHVYLEDNNSKFGTLVLIKKSLKLPSSKEISVQIGRTFMTIEVQVDQLRDIKK